MADKKKSYNEKSEKKSDKKLIEVALARFKIAEEAEMKHRQVALEDLKFKSGDQWPEEVKRQREQDRRPCLTVNRIPQHIRQVTNDQRQNRPAIQVSPVDDLADEKTAKVLQGLIRHIEYDSDADCAYDTAFEGAVTHGRGYLRVLTEYAHPMSFEQDIKICRIRNPFSVFMDPACQKPDYSDAGWGFITEEMKREEFEELYPKSEAKGVSDWETLGNHAPSWMKEDHIRVAEYYYIEQQKKRIVQLSNGQVILAEKLDKNDKGEYILEEGFEVVAERESVIPVVKWCKITCTEVLERTEWAGRWIPIIPCLGDEHDIDGEVILEGMVRHSKDSQRMYNFWVSAETETIALAPRAPFIGAEGQFEGHEEQWNTANSRNWPYLQYKPTTVAGKPAPPPSRNVFEPPIQAITNARLQSAEDIKATTGVYDAAMGNRSNETSGVAIQRRAHQAQTSNFHFIDNLTRSIRHLGRILIDLIPHIYDTERAIRVLGEDMEPEIVMINKYLDEEENFKHRFDIGRYDVTVTTGPSFTTKRQEAVEAMIQLTKAYPNIVQVAGDLMVKNMDWPGAQDIAERLKKTLPPELQDTGKNKKEVPPEIQAQIQQMQGMVEQLTQELNAAQEENDKNVKKIESEERIAFGKLQVQLMIEAAKIESADARAIFMKEIEELQMRQGLVGYNKPVSDSGQKTNSGGQEGGPQLNNGVM